MDSIETTWNSPLDPEDWDALRRQGHAMLDDMFDFMKATSEGKGPVWQPIPDEVRESVVEPLPQQPGAVDDAYRFFQRNIVPYSIGNVHPGFMGWVHGAGTPVGMLAEMLAAGLNANLGGRDHMPIEMEKQVVRWMRDLFSFPDSASGLFVTGSSVANLIGVLVARCGALGTAMRKQGLRQPEGQELVAYASEGAHGCISRAMDMAGLGSANLRLIAVREDGAMDTEALIQAVQADRQAGRKPFLIVGTAGSVNTGAIDDLDTLATLAADFNIHFHVDGAFGALAALSPKLAPRLRGIERADSIAMDFHKWMHVPYDAGFILVREGERQLETFADLSQQYLARSPHGMSAGTQWPCDLGPDLSRGFRALKTWFTFKVYGAAALGQAIAESCERAQYLAARINELQELELLVPVSLNIVCFRYRASADVVDAVNQRLLLAIQQSGIAAPSSTVIRGQFAIRAALFNHRTRKIELDRLINFVLTQGRIVARELADENA